MTDQTITQHTYDQEASLDRLVGLRLRQLREQALLSPEDLAALCGFPAEVIHEHEQAEIPLPVSRIRALASALDMEPEELFLRLVSRRP